MKISFGLIGVERTSIDDVVFSVRNVLHCSSVKA